MPIIVMRADAFPGWPAQPKKYRDHLREAVLRIQFSDLWRKPPGRLVTESGDVRIEIQGRWAKGPGQNIQARVGEELLAAILLADSLARTANTVDQAAVVNAVSGALDNSAEVNLWYIVTGTSALIDACV